MKCSNCGSQLNEGARFCRKCGTEIVEKTEVLEQNICQECGNLLEMNALFCNNCGHKLSEEYVQKNEVKKGAPSVPKKGKDKGLVFLIVLLIVVLIASASVIGCICFRNNFVNIETPNIETTADDMEERIDMEENDDATSGVTEDMEDSEYIDDNFNVEDEVLRIRNLYNTTQSNLSSLTKDSSESGKVEYYDSDSRLVRMDISANSVTPYTKYYYFENGELYFAFVFNGTKENRLYFKDGRLFRWIDESRKTHDKERSNSAFLEWEEIVINDLNYEL